jgi:DNA gyrase subunit B
MSEYVAKDIKVLSGLEGVRMRPAMYIGSTGPEGFHHLLWEVLDNAVDEALAGYANEIRVTLHKDGSASLEDNGRGIPVDIHPEEKVPALELVMTRLHAGAKFDHGVYKVSGGLHGVGVSVVNALSEWLIVNVYRDGKTYQQKYSRGNPLTPIEVIGKTNKRGTLVRFKPDPDIFGDLEFDLETVKRRIRELAFLNPEITFYLVDERVGYSEKFHQKGGIVEYVKVLNQKKEPVHSKVIYISGEKDKVKVEVALQYNTSSTETIFSYVNNIHTKEGGTHIVGFRTALTRALNRYLSEDKSYKGPKLEGEDVREGLCAVLSLKVPDPQFEGQTKMKLGNSEVKSIVDSIVYEGLLKFFESNPQEAKKILQRVIQTAKEREAARKARELTKKKSELEEFITAGKLADCTEKNPEKRELFIVEGDSAGGSAKQARDRRFQAILPLRGKILNVEKASLDKMLKSEEIKGLIATLACGIGDSFDPDKCNFRRIIIMTDADIDGAHIRTLLLTFFYRQMAPIIERGWLYIAQPPLYRVVEGKKEYYLKYDEELDKFLLKRIAKNLSLKPALSDPEPFFATLYKMEKHLLALAKKNYPPEVVLLLLTLGYVSLVNLEKEEDVEKLSQEVVKRSFKISKVKPSRDNPKYYEFNLLSEKEGISFCKVGPVLILEKDYRELVKLFEGLKPYLSQDLRVKFKDEERIFQGFPFSLFDMLNFLREEARKGLYIQRYKGLGEMNPKQLWETTMDPERRVLKKVSLKDAEKASELFSILMGENVEPRREFIYQHALEYRELDI